MADFSFHYEADPVAIERQSFETIRALTDLSGLDADAEQVAMRVVHSVGEPTVATQLRFSAGACAHGRAALAAGAPILCDVEMVRNGLTRRMLANPAHCFLNKATVAEQARASGETRSMVAVDHWLPLLDGSVVLIGNAPTALFRLLERLQKTASRPALIVGMPVGFIGAAESKDALWQVHQSLGIECITLLGRWGGSAVTAATCNALLRCNLGERY